MSSNLNSKLFRFHCAHPNLEPFQNTMLPKKGSRSVIGLWNTGPLNVVNDIKLILNDQEGVTHFHLELIKTFKRSPILQTSNWPGTLFWETVFLK